MFARSSRWYALGFALVASSAACDLPSTPDGGRIASLEILSFGLTLEPEFSIALTARARRADGTVLPQHGGTWSSSDPDVASVSATGSVRGVAPGEAFVLLTRDDLRDSVPVTVLSALPRDVWIADAHMTQATQASSPVNYLPMIHGRAAVVNASLWCTPACREPVEVALRIYGADGLTVRFADTSVVTSGFDAPDLVQPSVQFLVPAEVLTENLYWQLDADPAKTVPGNAATNDLFPRGERQRQFVVRVPPLKIRFIPIHLTGYPDGLATISDSDVERYLRVVRSAFPVDSVIASVGPTFTSARLYSAGSAVPYMYELLQDLDVARLAGEDDLETYWMGILKRPTVLTNVIAGGAAVRPASGEITGAGARVAIAPMAGTAAIDPLGAITVAHELGHNLGRPHSPCGAPDGLPTYPYAFGFIGSVGHDVQAWVEGRTTSAIGRAPDATADLMGYCSPSWISDFTYRSILVFRGVL